MTPPRIVSGAILLTGLAVSAECTGGMTLQTGTGKAGKVYRYYSCSPCACMGKSACKRQSIRMEKLDTLVTDHLSERLFTPERLPEIVSASRAANAAEVDGRAASLGRMARQAEDKLTRLYRMVEDGLTEMDDILRERLATLKQDRESAQRALDRIRARDARGVPLTRGGGTVCLRHT